MGRTLHFSIEKDTYFTEEECQVFQIISQRYNSGEFKDVWSCEDFWITCEDINETLIRDFTKVQGNEFNALLVFIALLEISNMCPDIKVHLYDEGKFLYCPLYIKQGKVLPDLETIKEDIRTWAAKTLFNNDTIKIMQDIRNEIYPRLDDISQRELGIGDPHSERDEILKEHLNTYADVIEILTEKCNLEGNELYHYNITERPVERWFEPQDWHRRVNIDKFKDYEMSIETVMDGYRGEGFGLADDGESYSYRQIAKIMNLFKKAGYDPKGISILGDDK